jgi:hypothetical protein
VAGSKQLWPATIAIGSQRVVQLRRACVQAVLELCWVEAQVAVGCWGKACQEDWRAVRRSASHQASVQLSHDSFIIIRECVRARIDCISWAKRYTRAGQQRGAASCQPWPKP